MTKFNRVAPVAISAIAASLLSASPAVAQPGANCQFGGGSTCASGPEDDYSDIILYGPGRRGVWGYGGLGGLYGDNVGPGISAGPG